MAAVEFDVRVGDLAAKSGDDESDWYLISVSTDIGMGGVGRATIEVAAGSAALPAMGDKVTIKLAGEPVFAGDVLGVDAGPDTLIIRAADGLAKLARLEVQGAYENKTAGAIAKDILQQAGLDAGIVDDGPKFARYVVHRGPRAMRHIEDLAERSGFSLFADRSGKINFTAPKTGGADHKLDYFADVLRLSLRAEAPAFNSAVVFGEGAAGEKGADRAHWLVTKLSSVSGKASIDADWSVQPGKLGDLPLTLRDGAVRAAGDAADQAKARMSALAARSVRGYIEAVGDAAVEPGNLVELEAIPSDHQLHALASGRALLVRRVRQAYSARRGFVTRMEL